MVTSRFVWVDLQDRWQHYTRRGLYKVRKWPDFPKPVEALGRGRILIWHLSDITAFESAHPELTSNIDKLRKVSGYQRARAKGSA